MSSECFSRERAAIHHGSVVQRSVREWLVEVQVDPQPNAVVQDEVPRPVARPREEPVDTSLRERDKQLLKVCGRRPYVKVRMVSRLLPEQRIHAPSAPDTRIHAVGVEPLHKRDYIRG